MKKSIREEFKKRVEELEANILAYQDLLITKEEEINTLTKKITSSEGGDFSVEK